MPRFHSGASRIALLLVVMGITLLTLSTSAGAQTRQQAPTVDIVSVSGSIDPTMVDYLDTALGTAAAENAEVVVIELDSTGLLNVDLDQALAPLLEREVPVAVWVGPPGARATGGAAWLAAAADVVAVAPGALFGFGEVGAGVGSLPEDSEAGMTDLRQRLSERQLLDGAVVASVGVETDLPADAALPGDRTADDVRVATDTSMVEGGIVDLVALNLQDALAALDGRTVTVGGAEQTLDVDPVTANVRFNNQGLWGRILHAAANPALAYLLLIAGLMAIAFEVFQPGFGVAGLSGVVTAGLALYGLTVLPTRPLMAALIVVGIALLSVDLAVGGFGLVTLSGLAALAIGSVRLFEGDTALAGWLIALVVAFAGVFFVGIMTTVLRAQGTQARAGAARVTGKLGVVRSMLNPEGHVFVDGALWRARAPDSVGRVKTGTTVRVVGTSDGLTLDVELSDDPDRAPAA